ncbi:MAG: hypothetical protein WBE68_09290 [Candidatus Nitrosopolaris sp.]
MIHNIITLRFRTDYGIARTFQVNGQAVVMTLLKKPSTETIGIKEFSASCDLCDLCDLCDHIDLVSFSVFFSTLLIPLEIETSDFFRYTKD